MTPAQAPYLPFTEFVRLFRPLSPARVEALEALRQITVASEDAAIIKDKLRANGFDTQTRAHAMRLFSYWYETYKSKGVTRITAIRRLPVQKPAQPKGAVAVKCPEYIYMHGPIEIDVGGSFMLVPPKSIAWVKQVDDERCLVALTTGEIIEADGALGEFKDQLTNLPPMNGSSHD